MCIAISHQSYTRPRSLLPRTLELKYFKYLIPLTCSHKDILLEVLSSTVPVLPLVASCSLTTVFSGSRSQKITLRQLLHKICINLKTRPLTDALACASVYHTREETMEIEA